MALLVDRDDHEAGAFRHQHQGRRPIRRLRVPAGHWGAGGVPMVAERPCHETPSEEGPPADQPHGFDALGLCQQQTSDDQRVCAEANVLFDPRGVLRPPQPIPGAVASIARGGDSDQQPDTARRFPVAPQGRVACVGRALAPLPHGCDGTRRVLTRTAAAILRSCCHAPPHVVIGGPTGREPRGSTLGSRLTNLRGRFRPPHDRLEPRSSGVYGPSPPRPSPVVLGRGLHDHGPIGLALEGPLALRRCIAGGRTLLGGARGR